MRTYLPMYKPEIANQELLERVALRNRPSLSHDNQRLRTVSENLAADANARRRFLRNPSAYLSSQGVAIGRATLVAESRGRRTSEEIALLVEGFLIVGVCQDIVCKIYIFVSGVKPNSQARGASMVSPDV